MIPSADPLAAYRAHKQEIDRAVLRVLSQGRYVLGPEVQAFEAEFAAFCGAAHCVGASSGTDAVALALRALGVGPGHVVFAPSHTATATVAAIEMAGAAPVLLDVEPDTYCLDPAHLKAALEAWAGPGQPKAVVAVHLYGHPADLDAIGDIAREHGLLLVEDCAQAHGAMIGGRTVGSMGDAAAFSFYPTKNLGALGDGGAVTTSDAAVAERLRGLRQYGWDDRRTSREPGVNSRLDEVQAAVLRVKLGYLAADNARRRELAAIYDAALAGGAVRPPAVRPGVSHVYHQYVIQHPDRDVLAARLADAGVGTAVHYPQAAHQMPGYAGRVALGPGGLPVTEALLPRILSLPVHPELTREQVERVAREVARLA